MCNVFHSATSRAEENRRLTNSKEAPKQADGDQSDKIQVVLFKSETCAFCPRAEEVIRETIEDLGPDTFYLTVVNVTENPEVAEEYGVFALPTVMVGSVSITGIPEPDMLVRMILGASVAARKKGESK
jgi:thiol-disulfide isomerase/thioredoxin